MKGRTLARPPYAAFLGTRSAGSVKRQGKFFLGSVLLHFLLAGTVMWVAGLISPAAERPILVRMVEEVEELMGTPRAVDPLDLPPVPRVMVEFPAVEEPVAELALERPEVLMPPLDVLPDTPPPRQPRQTSLEQHVRVHAPSPELTLLPPTEAAGDDHFVAQAEELFEEVTKTGQALQELAPERHAALPPPPSQGTEADYLRNPKPPYPQLAREKGYEGDVYLKVLVLHDGTVGDISIYKSSGYEVLDMAALSAVREWLFVPATRDGVPVARWAIVPVKFRLP